jgi:hypothetical protein
MKVQSSDLSKQEKKRVFWLKLSTRSVIKKLDTMKAEMNHIIENNKDLIERKKMQIQEKTITDRAIYRLIRMDDGVGKALEDLRKIES